MSPQPSHPPRTTSRLAVALGIAAVLAVLLWIAAPYNNFVLGNIYIADDNLPAAVVFVIFVLVLVVNPVLRWLRPGAALSFPQLAAIFGVLLVASVPITSGFLRMLPYTLAQGAVDVAGSTQLARYYATTDMPSWLFPVELGYRADVTVAKDFLQRLAPGESLPWRAWLRPAVAWSGFALPYWMMMIGLAALMLPQWREHERLPMPLLRVQRAMIESPPEGRLLPPMLCNRVFWFPALIVLAVHVLNGLSVYRPELFPRIPLQPDFGQLFSTDPWRHISNRFQRPQVHFIFLGVAFFMANRMAFSLWAIPLVYGAFQMLNRAYFPPHHVSLIADHRTGAVWVVAALIVWLGRHQWRRAARSLRRGGASPDDRYLRHAAWLFVLGCLGLTVWLIWAGVQWWWAAVLTAMAVGYALVISRLVAESGLALTGLFPQHVIDTLRLVPVGWVRPMTAWMTGVMATYFGSGGRVCGTVMAMHGLGLDDGAPAPRRRRLVYAFLFVMLAGLAVGWVVHLKANYTHSQTLDGREQPLGGTWGVNQLVYGEQLLGENVNGRWDEPVYSRPGQIALGASITGALYALSFRFPRWPLHPLGMVLIDTWFMQQIWFSVMLGWLLRWAILASGGSRLYVRAQPAFVGVILGEAAAVVLWALVAAVFAGLDMRYEIVQILPY